MSESSPPPHPKPLTDAEKDATPNNVSTRGPLNPTRPALEGSEDFLCPECAAPLAVRTHRTGFVAEVKRLDCYNCHLAWWPKDLISVAHEPRRADAARKGPPFFDIPPQRG